MNDNDIKLPPRPEPDGFITDGPFDKPVVINVYRDSTLEAYARDSVRMNACESRASTHAEGCWSWGPAHYKCAMREIERLSEELSKMRAEPSDEEIDAIAASMPDGAGGMLKQWGYRQFARALLARYGQPAEGVEPVARIYRKGFQHGSIVWTAAGLAADLPDGTELYAAIDAAQAQPKRRPYNASGSLSEHGIPPECDAAPVAQDPAKGVDVALRYNWNEHLIEHNAPEYQHDFMLFKVVEAYVLKHLADRQQRGGDVVSAFDAAVAAELPKVSTLEYNSHEICKHFAERVRAALAAQPATHPDDVAVDRFAAAMKAKLAKKRAEGRNGWDDKAQCSQELLSRLLSEHVEKGDPVDVGNFAMMLHQRGEKITAQAPTANADARDAARWRTAVKNWRVKNVEIFDGVTLTNRSGIHWDDLIRQVDAARAAGGDQ